MRYAIWNLKLFNPSQELLIWNFQMRLETRCTIWNFLSLKFNISQGLLISNFQMRLEMRHAIWNMKLFNHVIGVAYLKLSDETYEKMWYSKPLKLLKLETFQTFQIHQRGCLFETFRWDLKWDMLFETFWNLKLWCVLYGQKVSINPEFRSD